MLVNSVQTKLETSKKHIILNLIYEWIHLFAKNWLIQWVPIEYKQIDYNNYNEIYVLTFASISRKIWLIAKFLISFQVILCQHYSATT